MKHSLSLLITALLVFVILGCSGGNKLTNKLAQGAVTQWVGGNGTATVTGVLELPQENMAKVDVEFSQFKYQSSDWLPGVGTPTQTYSGSGVAIFAHYNDGRWILKQVTLAKRGVFGPIQWDNLNIVATGEGANPPNSALLSEKGSSKQSVVQDVKNWTSMMISEETAIVGTNEAVFTFSVDPKKEYRWCRDEKTLHSWSVEVGDNFKFGYSYFYYTNFAFKDELKGSPPCATGNLQQLLRQGQFSAWIKTGADRFSVMSDVKVDHHISPDGKQLVFALRDVNAISRIFPNKPEQVAFTTRILEEKSSRPVRVRYP